MPNLSVHIIHYKSITIFFRPTLHVSKTYILRQSSTLFLTADISEFSEHPQNQTVLEGLNVAFSCNASGNPTPKFSWTKNGSPINTTDNARISLSAGNKQLNITNVNRVDSGEYRCVADNSVGAVNSSAAFLTVQCKNTFTHFL